MINAQYKIPVKIRLEPGRYRHGHVKKLPSSKGEKVSIRYADGRISSRNGDSIIHEPQGFKLLTT